METYPTIRNKIIVLLGSPKSGSPDKDSYLGVHAQEVLGCGSIESYHANWAVSDPYAEMMRTTNGSDPYGVVAIDEITGCSWNDVKKMYAKFNIIGAYDVTEYALREIHAERPLGTMTPEIKRIGLLTRPVGKSHEEAMLCWLRDHPPLCFRYLSGMASYYQNHIERPLTAESVELDGFPVLSYWNDAAFRYGHFASPEIKKLLVEDCMRFRSTSFQITVEEYVMKRRKS